MMKTYPANALAEMLERDRGTLLRALRNTPADIEVHGKSQWKISTAANALALHATRGGSGNSSAPLPSNPIDPRLQRHYDAFDAADAAMRMLPTLEARRQAAIDMGPQIAKMDLTQRQISLADGNDEEITDFRADKLFFLYLRGFEEPCAWSMSEVWAAVDVRK
jgi:hypothetical protein